MPYFLPFSGTRADAKKELKERTEAPRDVASVADDSSKRERKLTQKMVESVADDTHHSVGPSKVRYFTKLLVPRWPSGLASR